MADAPDVDLLIRSGGEQRLSDFLLWECAYAELWFTRRCGRTSMGFSWHAQLKSSGCATGALVVWPLGDGARQDVGGREPGGRFSLLARPHRYGECEGRGRIYRRLAFAPPPLATSEKVTDVVAGFGVIPPLSAVNVPPGS